MTAIALPRYRNTFLDRLRTIQFGIGARGALGAGLATQRGGGAAAGNGLLNALIAYWALNETSGDALDLHSSKTLTATASPGFNTGKIYSTARELLPVSTQYFSRSDADLRGGSDFTVAVWMKPYSMQTTPNYHMILDCLGYAGGWSIGMWGGVTEMQTFIQIGLGNGAYYPASHAAVFGDQRNVWHLFVAWLDYTGQISHSTINNGSDAQPQSGGGAMAAGSYTLICGANKNKSGLWWDGQLGPVAYWSRILTSDDRTALWNSGAGLAYTGFTS